MNSGPGRRGRLIRGGGFVASSRHRSCGRSNVPVRPGRRCRRLRRIIGTSARGGPPSTVRPRFRGRSSLPIVPISAFVSFIVPISGMVGFLIPTAGVVSFVVPTAAIVSFIVPTSAFLRSHVSVSTLGSFRVPTSTRLPRVFSGPTPSRLSRGLLSRQRVPRGLLVSDQRMFRQRTGALQSVIVRAGFTGPEGWIRRRGTPRVRRAFWNRGRELGVDDERNDSVSFRLRDGLGRIAGSGHR